MDEKVSIIVPVFNVESYLDRCINSLVRQTYKNIEIILVNDGSSDGSAAICKRYSMDDNRIIFIDQCNQGLSAARNAGIDRATGNYICFVDSDDWVEFDYVQFGMDLIKENCAEIAVVSSFDSYDDRDVVTTKGWLEKESRLYSSSESMKLLVEDVTIKSHAWDKIYDIRLFNDIRFPAGKNFEDIFIMHSIFAKANRVVISRQPKYHYFIRQNSIAREYKTKNILDYFDAEFERLKFLERYNNELTALQHTKLMELVLSYYPKFKRKGAPNLKCFISHRKCFCNCIKIITSLYRQSHEEFTEPKYKYMYKVFRFNRQFFAVISPAGNYLIDCVKKSKFKSEIKRLLYKDESFITYLDKFKDKKKIVLIGVPEYDNLGDVAIGYCEEQFIGKHKRNNAELLVITENNFWKYFHNIKRAISDTDVIAIQGGGNFGNQYPDQEKLRKKIIKNFNCKIILMPSTFYLTNEKKDAIKYAKLYNKNNIKLFAREMYSYEKMKKYFTCKVDLCPDIVLSHKVLNETCARKGVGLCLRNDLESRFSNIDKSIIKSQLLKHFPVIYQFDTCINHQVPYSTHEEVLNYCWKAIAQYEVVVTDKLHAMIFCALTNTPCIVLGNYNYKIKGVYEWIKEENLIQFVEDYNMISDRLDMVLSKEKRSLHMDFQFDNLIRALEEN